MICLKFNEESVFSGTEFDDDFLCFIDYFLIDKLIFLMVVQLKTTFVCFFIQKDRCNEVIFLSADEREFEKIKNSRFDDSMKVELLVINFDGFVIVSEKKMIVRRYFNERIAGLVVVISGNIFFKVSHSFKSLQVDDESFSLVRIHLFQNL